MATWPSMLPAASDPRAYGIEPETALARTDMDGGPARQRRRFTSAPTRVPVRFEMTVEQFAVFEAWFHHEIDDGAAGFEAPFYNGAGMTQVEARFVEPWRTRMSGPRLFQVSAVWEVRQRPVMSAAALDAILNPE